jgi:hypothetical protein
MKQIKAFLPALLLMFAIGLHAQRVGIGTTTPKASLNVAEYKTVLFGKDTTGGGGKLMWLSSKYCFRAGVTGPIYGVGGGEYDYGNPAVWDYDSLGFFSFAGGFNNLALGNSSVALGGYNQARGEFSIALGNTNIASGNYSFAAGIVAVASRYGAVAIGQGAKALNDNATAIGNYVEASGNSSLATGYITKASGFSSTSTGHYTEASGYFSFAGGSESKSLGLYSIAIGNKNIALGSNSVAFGSSTKANADHATAIGLSSVANAMNSFVIGRYNDTIAGSNLNSWVPSDPLFLIGNGTSNTNRKNAMTMLKNGNTGFGTNAPAGLMHLKYNSNPGIPNLMLEESGNDYARITFKNANPGFWDVSAYTHQIFGENVDSRFSFYCASLGGNVLTLKGNGDASLSGTLTQYSDERLKQHIQPIGDVLDKLKQLQGYTYQWKDIARGSDMQIGLLAQEVEKQFPQLVHTDEEGMKSVAYSNMIPVLIEAIKEQQEQINELRELLERKTK